MLPGQKSEQRESELSNFLSPEPRTRTAARQRTPSGSLYKGSGTQNNPIFFQQNKIEERGKKQDAPIKFYAQKESVDSFE